MIIGHSISRMDFINISVYNQASTSNYVRSTFAPHGDFDIFRRDDIEIEQLLAEQLLVEVNLTDIDNSVEEKLERIPPKVGVLKIVYLFI
jgi:hypothetical protein